MVGGTRGRNHGFSRFHICIVGNVMNQITEGQPPHPLVMDQETKLFRYATHSDIRRWEHMELRYSNLLAALKELTNAD
jgi:hypothetical protein